MRGPRNDSVRRLPLAAVVVAALAAGCTIAPRSFVQNRDPAPLVRARALGLGRDLPDSSVIPTLIEKLQDPDAVVRMTAHEELRQRTGQDFGYAPWAEPTERAAAVHAWQSWWQKCQRGWASAPATPNPRQAAPSSRRRPGPFFGRSRPVRADAEPMSYALPR